MNPNDAVVTKLLEKVAERPTGFAPNQTIYYGVLPAGFLEAHATGNLGKDFAEANPVQMAMVAQAFAAWEKFLGVKFARDDAQAQIRFGVGDLTGVPSDNGVTDAGGYNIRQYTGNTATDYNIVVMPKTSDLAGTKSMGSSLAFCGLRRG